MDRRYEHAEQPDRSVDGYKQDGAGAIYQRGASGLGPFLGIAFSPAIGRWYHIAFTFDDATKQESLYLDAVRVASANAGRSIGYDSHPVLLGREIENGSSNFFFAGNIDEAAFYNRALTTAEIASIYVADVVG